MEKRKGFEIILICSSCPAAAAGMRELCDNWQLGQRGGKVEYSLFDFAKYERIPSDQKNSHVQVNNDVTYQPSSKNLNTNINRT